MRWQCRIGFHKWTTREVHQMSHFNGIKLDTGLVLRCDCGATKIPPYGHIMETVFMQSSKFFRRSS